MSIHIRQAALADALTLGRIIGRAFAEDPLTRWTLSTAKQIETTFISLTRHVYLPRGLCMMAEGMAGTLWLPPGQNKQLPLGPMAMLGAQMLSSLHPRHALRALAVDSEMIRRRPTYPHYYLFAVGVLPEARGQGYAPRLINQTLALADAEGVPAFLENTNPKNHRLYCGLGFEPVETYRPAEGAPEITGMVRWPRKGGC